ncbi:hypothetical protein LWP59_01600 [Amycolatopsis acidiphila]|uniref:hypothetical protein n=1 Tax=Amycolatopsis acidiphila TaxID=715473 RepID=UPI001643F46F|nr:hypothetical protein [Amycolatopsis acidiphila]UIJ64219.1 hypothetical protein LWP59_01600 [Amycolatopsis acidiphila]GHG90298.1 hypothetical protein GCM10017788_65510 [Amycolatopsis acidiphila]
MPVINRSIRVMPWPGRTRSKSDPIDALAVARAALREPGLPQAHLDEQALEVKLLPSARG